MDVTLAWPTGQPDSWLALTSAGTVERRPGSLLPEPWRSRLGAFGHSEAAASPGVPGRTAGDLLRDVAAKIIDDPSASWDGIITGRLAGHLAHGTDVGVTVLPEFSFARLRASIADAGLRRHLTVFMRLGALFVGPLIDVGECPCARCLQVRLRSGHAVTEVTRSLERAATEDPAWFANASCALSREVTAELVGQHLDDLVAPRDVLIWDSAAGASPSREWLLPVPGHDRLLDPAER